MFEDSSLSWNQLDLAKKSQFIKNITARKISGDNSINLADLPLMWELYGKEFAEGGKLYSPGGDLEEEVTQNYPKESDWMHHSGGHKTPLMVIGSNLIFPDSHYYTGAFRLGEDLQSKKEDAVKGRDLIELYLNRNESGFEKIPDAQPITIYNRETKQNETWNYPQYVGNILPQDTVFLRPESEKVIQALVENKNLLPIDQAIFAHPEYMGSYVNVSNKKGKILDDVGLANISFKRDENGNYYADVFDKWDFDKTVPLGSWLENRIKQKKLNNGPFILRQRIPIVFTRNGESDGMFLSDISKGKWREYQKQYKANGGNLFALGTNNIEDPLLEPISLEEAQNYWNTIDGTPNVLFQTENRPEVRVVNPETGQVGFFDNNTQQWLTTPDASIGLNEVAITAPNLSVTNPEITKEELNKDLVPYDNWKRLTELAVNNPDINNPIYRNLRTQNPNGDTSIEGYYDYLNNSQESADNTIGLAKMGAAVPMMGAAALNPLAVGAVSTAARSASNWMISNPEIVKNFVLDTTVGEGLNTVAQNQGYDNAAHIVIGDNNYQDVRRDIAALFDNTGVGDEIADFGLSGLSYGYPGMARSGIELAQLGKQGIEDLVKKASMSFNGKMTPFPKITKTTDNGKIKLSLPSSTAEKPRQIVLEPQGDNKYYVHMKIWNDIENKVPGNISNEEKKQLFDALYDELPEGAEILLPKSNSDYVATRGTVAGLQRLARDPRFTPGTEGTLYYADKDGSIKTFNGTSFIKNSQEQPVLQDIYELYKNPQQIIENYTSRTGRVPAELVDDNTVLKEGMNVKQLYIDEQIKIKQQQNPNMTYEEAKEALDAELKKQGISIRDIEDADGLNVTFDLPENQQFNGIYGSHKLSQYRKNLTRTHEDNHLSRGHVNKTDSYSAEGFRQPENEAEKYLSDNEKSSYGTEIFGILGKKVRNLTGKELKWLHDNAMQIDTPPELIRLLNMITDYDKAAKWFNKNSNIITALGVSSTLGSTLLFDKNEKDNTQK